MEIAAEKMQTLAEFWPRGRFLYDGPVHDKAAFERVVCADGGVDTLRAAREVPESLAALVAHLPIPVHWLRQPEGPLPASAVVHPSWNRLAGELDALSTTPVFGLSFAPRRGVRANGTVVQAPALEGLMAAHPRGLPPFDGVQRLQRTIERHALPCLVQMTDSVVRLCGAG